MKRIVSNLADQSDRGPAELADQVDELVHDVLRKLKKGQPARIPGLGQFLPGAETKFVFEKNNAPKNNRRTSR